MARSGDLAVNRDDLHAPLGLEGPSLAPRRWRGPALAIVACAALAAAAWGFARAPGAPDRAVVDITVAKPEPAAKAQAQTAAPKIPGAADSTMDVENGVRVFRGGAMAPAGGAVIQVPADSPTASGAAGGLTAAPDPRLVENGRWGPLPKIGPAGELPFDVYKRAPTTISDAPKIAVVLTGFGLSADSLRLANAGLQPDTTFAFAPIGPDLWNQAAEARRAGHEILLQTPMEPVATTGGDHWAHELTTEASPARNIDDLRWSMARFPGYVGVMNFLGSKLTMDATAMTPILREVGARGLGWLDDGSSSASLAPSLTARLGLHSARADLSVDPDASGPALDAALANVETLARNSGAAIVVAPALPDVIARMKAFESEAVSDGFRIAPVSDLMPRATTAPAP
jgi:hypothetical protein